MQDLTKILKVGDPVWSIMFGEGVVSVVEAGVNLPFAIVFKSDDVPSCRWFDKHGRYAGLGQPQLYPIEQRPEIPAPQWPEVFEIDGVTYKKGEWVAVSDPGVDWTVRELHKIEGENFIVTKGRSSPFLNWTYIRKLSSFNEE